MIWFTKKPPRGIEIPRLIKAAHEVGHYITFCDAGVPVREVVLRTVGDIDGYTLVGDPADNQHHGYLVAVMGGTAGERLWCEIYGQRLPAHFRSGRSGAGDRDEFRHYQRHNRAARGLSQRKAERLARAILLDNTKRFRKLTEQLAVDGELQI